MVKEVIHDPILLRLKSELATKEDLQVAQDLLDTLAANKNACVGMAANMIGVRKRIIVFDNEGTYMTMFNPEILKKSDLMTQRKAAFLYLEDLVPAGAIKPSRFSGRTSSFKPASKPLPAGQHRSFSTKSIIVMEY